MAEYLFPIVPQPLLEKMWAKACQLVTTMAAQNGKTRQAFRKACTNNHSKGCIKYSDARRVDCVAKNAKDAATASLTMGGDAPSGSSTGIC